jgi:RimJ/RimL family protein N-acetyltransferase
VITVRPARIEDAAALCAAERDTARTPGLIVSHPDELSPRDFESLIDELSDGSGCYVVAEEDGRPVGHAFLKPMELRAVRHVFRLTIVVHPGHSGHGIGTVMMGALLDWARRTPAVRKVELIARSTNERALRIYTNFGFVEEGRFRNRIRLADGSYIDDVTMAWFPERATER